ncbi:hypothetical protein WME79_11660 [Sorangium sp. So ce726]|uniref:hypothetical protein n=1 Tax=Sorangium sp. So ce726 TaxID=3133319 RepID=UPI003F62A4B9
MNATELNFESPQATRPAPCGCATCLTRRSTLSERAANALANELLEVTSEAELDRFLGKIFRGIKRGIAKIGRFAKRGISFLGRGLKAVGKLALKGIAKIGLPTLGRVVGSYFGGSAGALLGSRLGSFADKLISKDEMEMGGLSQEQYEHEVARRYVHFVADSTRNLMRRDASGDPERDALDAMTLAARRSASGQPIVRATSPAGRWFRRPEGLVLVGA